MVTLLKDLFRRSLKKHPVVTNMTVYATFYAAADLSQQAFNRYQSPDIQKAEYNFAATAKIASVGSSVYAPALFYCYRFLDMKLPGTAVKTVATKLIADQGVITPVLLATFYLAMAVVERREDLFEEMREKYFKTYLANQTFWIPAQTINFFFVPAQLRVVYVASVSFLWINVLCYIKRQKLESDVSKKIEA